MRSWWPTGGASVVANYAAVVVLVPDATRAVMVTSRVGQFEAVEAQAVIRSEVVPALGTGRGVVPDLDVVVVVVVTHASG